MSKVNIAAGNYEVRQSPIERFASGISSGVGGVAGGRGGNVVVV